MTAPVDQAFAAFAGALAAALVAGGFLASADQLEQDPESPFAPNGDEVGLVTAAALFRGDVQAPRVLLGRPSARYDVTQFVEVEALAAGGTKVERLAALAAAEAALAAVHADPTLAGAARWLTLAEARRGDLPPNALTFTAIVALEALPAGDPLGRTQPVD